jgi:general stress protein 26
MNDVLLRKAEDLINKCTAHTRESGFTFDWVMALTDEFGYPSASMITASRADGANWIAFCTGLGANKPNRIRKDPRACIYLFESKSFSGISLTGKIEILTDIETKRQMWYAELADHFKGPEDEGLCVLMFKTERYNIFIDYQNISGEFSR